jgi:hypothetical protein
MATPFPTIDAKALSDFSGRPEGSFGPFVPSAAMQALLLFKIATGLDSMPDGETNEELANMGLLAMTDKLYLANQYRESQASPFSSESIGSYSYSKAARQAAAGEDTGVMWFDLAVSKLSRSVDDGLQMHGGIEVFEHDIYTVSGTTGANRRMLSPQDVNLSIGYGYDPAGYGMGAR